MELTNKVAIVHGAGGAVGGAVARAFGRAGAKVYLAGHRLESLRAVQADLTAAGGPVEVAAVDALDPASVDRHADAVADTAGGIDICFNAIGLPVVQGVPLTNLPLEDFTYPINALTSSQFLTARAAARHMIPRGRGVILTMSASPARLAIPGGGGFSVACAAIEALTRGLAAELGPHGVRAVCLRAHRIADSGPAADPRSADENFRTFLKDMTLLNRLPTLAEVAATATFVASDAGGAMTGAVANLTCGMSVD